MDEIVEKSIFNCHAKGLHSIMFLESPEKTIRMYVSVPFNDLHRNFPDKMHAGLSLAFHPHHCNLTLHCIKGRLLNWEMTEVESYDSICLDKYIYQSKIKSDDILFKSIGKGYLKTKELNYIHEGESRFMEAGQIHTVACDMDTMNAWFVYEGKEDANYQSVCWSNSNPNATDFSDLYIKPSKEQIAELLKTLSLIP